MAVMYELLLENEEVFTECQDNPKGYLNMGGFWDFSAFNLEMVEEGVILSGNITSVWNVQSTDYIEASASIFYLDRGSWQQTILNMVSRDFCKHMYEDNQLWYMYWTEHVTNDVRDKCVSLGTTQVIEKYLLKLKFPLDVALRSGRYKIVFQFHASDRAGKKRKTSICFEIIGEFTKSQ
ncbi:uncharacterized protein LOC111077838 [Drosophila obscura]|uniref:uncharacterized protein LOC111077838 n=1 Tax=Drosophila obscura TaxID=7282 RepID=UPI000BA00BD4|nr:uncharacterized protein LOC111077838 [Drosophila obscura]